MVVAGTAIDQIITGTARNSVCPIRPGQNVIKTRSNGILDFLERIGTRATSCGTRTQINLNTTFCTGIIDGIGTIATDERIIPCTTDQRIVARSAKKQVITITTIKDVASGTARKHVILVIPGKRIVVGRSGNIFEIGKCIGALTGCRTCSKIDIHARAGVLE